MLSLLFDVEIQVIYNLHVVFTMNPSSEGLKSRAATSPALFNRSLFLLAQLTYLLPAEHGMNMIGVMKM
jgi:hypothetical protein